MLQLATERTACWSPLLPHTLTCGTPTAGKNRPLDEDELEFVDQILQQEQLKEKGQQLEESTQLEAFQQVGGWHKRMHELPAIQLIAADCPGTPGECNDMYAGPELAAGQRHLLVPSAIWLMPNTEQEACPQLCPQGDGSPSFAVG